VDLDLMQPGQQLHELTARVLEGVTRALRQVRPDLVLVQGDTTTAMASAMAAFYERIPVGHVEAGLRTGDMDNPFPEEMNRRAIATLASLHFAPTEAARTALLAEGVPPERVVMTGNTVVDALRLVTGTRPVPTNRRRILVTAHRRESFGAPFENICLGLRRLAGRNPELELVYPVHPNPQVREPAVRLLGDLPNVRLTDPLGYADFVRAMQEAYLLLTDSGGVQEEATSLRKPFLILRDKTERLESVEAGASRLVGTDPARIVAETERLFADEALYARMASARNPFGDGRAAERIVERVDQRLGAAQGEKAEIRRAA
jgi:UDP-N-acetylglucosamine 2-epimerase (non-hydrolysing)